MRKLRALLELELDRLGLLYREVGGELIQVIEVKVDGARLPFGAGSFPLDMDEDVSKAKMVEHLLSFVRPSENDVFLSRRGRQSLRDLASATMRRHQRLARMDGVTVFDLDLEHLAKEKVTATQVKARPDAPIFPVHKRLKRKGAGEINEAAPLLSRPVMAYHTRHRTTVRIVRSMSKHGWRNGTIHMVVREWLERPGHKSVDLELDPESVFEELGSLVHDTARAARWGTRWENGGGIRYLPDAAPKVMAREDVWWIAARLGGNKDLYKAGLLVAERFRLLDEEECEFGSPWFKELLGKRYSSLRDGILGVIIEQTAAAVAPSTVTDNSGRRTGTARRFRLLLPTPVLTRDRVSIPKFPWSTTISARLSHAKPSKLRPKQPTPPAWEEALGRQPS
jgi:hypothetical protein